jgi:hypothetical protein
MRTFILLLLISGLAVLQAGEAEALAIHQQIRDRHMPYGAVMDPMFTSPDTTDIFTYTRCGDSAIWTGHYLAAESYRWAVTRSPEAREQIMAALNGIRKLVDVTGNDTLARCAFPVDSPYATDLASEEQHHGIHTGIIDGIPHFWVGNTSRDQYMGVFFGLTAAFQMVPDQEVHDWVAMLSTRMLQRLLNDNFNIVIPNQGVSTTFLHRADQQLALLKLGRRIHPRAFETAYRTRANLFAPSVPTILRIEAADEHSSYFKFNLAHIGFYNLLTSGDNWVVSSLYRRGYDVLRGATEGHNNVFFDTIATLIEGRQPERDERIRRGLDAWLERPRRDFWVDLRPVYPPCGNDDNRGCQVVPIAERTPTDFLWQRSPFQLYGGLYGTIEGAGIDYILPYWMARHAGIVH